MTRKREREREREMSPCVFKTGSNWWQIWMKGPHWCWPACRSPPVAGLHWSVSRGSGGKSPDMQAHCLTSLGWRHDDGWDLEPAGDQTQVWDQGRFRTSAELSGQNLPKLWIKTLIALHYGCVEIQPSLWCWAQETTIWLWQRVLSFHASGLTLTVQ